MNSPGISAPQVLHKLSRGCAGTLGAAGIPASPGLHRSLQHKALPSSSCQDYSFRPSSVSWKSKVALNPCWPEPGAPPASIRALIPSAAGIPARS